MRINLFSIIIIFSVNYHSQNIDFDVLKSINSKSNPVWDDAMRGTSNSIYIMMPVSPVITYIIGYNKKDSALKRNAVKSAIGICVSLAINTGLKYVVNRTRPFTEYPSEIIQRDKNVGPYSFPSGHSSSAFATATTLSLSFKKWYVTVPAFGYAALVGYSRMRLGVHYPSDVLGGMITGIGCSLIVWKIEKWMNKKK